MGKHIEVRHKGMQAERDALTANEERRSAPPPPRNTNVQTERVGGTTKVCSMGKT